MARIVVLASLLALSLVLSADIALADRWPLGPGSFWDYSTADYNSTQYVEMAPGTQVVRGVECLIMYKKLLLNTGVHNLHHFVTKDADGYVRLHGYRNLDVGYTRSLVPPVLMLKQPMIMGDKWQTRTTIHDGLDFDGKPGPYVIETYEVITDVVIDFAFGTHQAYGLLRTSWVERGTASPEDLGWRPELLDADKEIAHIYHSHGIGVVVEYSNRLVRYATTVAAERSSWSDLKTMFR